VNSAAIIHTGGIGDFLQTFPVLEALHTKWPGIHVTIIGHLERARLACAGGLAEAAVDFETSHCHRLFVPEASATDVPAALGEADLILNFLSQPALNDNLERLTGARIIHAASFPGTEAPAIPVAQFVYDQIASELGLPRREAIPRLRLTTEALAKTPMAINFSAIEKAIAIHPGSGSPKKNWPPERFTELAALLADAGTPVLWILGPAELEPSVSPWARVSSASPGAQALVGAALLDVATTLGLVAGFVGNDSGITHLAAALGRPTVALFGPTDWRIWAPRGQHVRVLIAPGGNLPQISASEAAQALAGLRPCPPGL
jgi:ADP-heptose:LPS heptosyltransferase